ncbi:MAG: hypothetical protein KIS92_10145 [Planctomycetota bacterium]|nr:hypothetical protein [Planctomycetota bacterium]
MKTYAMVAAALFVGLSLTAHADENEARGPGKGKHHPNREEMLKRFDKDGDGKLSDAEKAAAKAARGEFKGKKAE